MIAVGKRIGICLLIAGLVCIAFSVPALAAPGKTADNRIDVIGPSNNGGVGSTQQATTVVTAVIEAPTNPDNPDDPDHPTTGDTSNLTVYWILLGVAAAGIITVVILLVAQRKK